ncbi:MAG: hypothetical protein ACM34E_07910, partial [Acidobacteriota bacterium]
LDELLKVIISAPLVNFGELGQIRNCDVWILANDSSSSLNLGRKQTVLVLDRRTGVIRIWCRQ